MKKTNLFAILAGIVLFLECNTHGSGPEGTFKEKKVFPEGTRKQATKVEMAIPDVNAGESRKLGQEKIAALYEEQFRERN